MAEREGFEPSLELPLNSISSAAPSTARPPLRGDATLRAARVVRLSEATPPGQAAPAGRSAASVETLHGQADAALLVNFHHPNLDHIADGQLVADALHPVLANLRDMHHAIAAGQNRHERTEVHDPDHLALVNLPCFHVGGDLLDAAAGLVAGGLVHGGNFDDAIVGDVDGSAGFLGNGADGDAALADHIADLLRVDAQGGIARRVFGQLLARLDDGLTHLAENVQPPLAGLGQRLLHDLAGDAVNLDVHLQGGDAVGGAGHLEIHVAQMVLVADDVGQHREAVRVLDQAHGDPGHRGLDRHAGVHQRQAGAAHRRHGTGTVGFGDFRHHPHRVGELLGFRHDRLHPTLGQPAVADFPALGTADLTDFADRIGREVVVQQERLAVFAPDGVDDLGIAVGAERGDHQRLGLAPGEQRRTVGARQDADPDGDRPHGAGVAAVDARLAGQDAPAHDLALQRRERALDRLRGPAFRFLGE